MLSLEEISATKIKTTSDEKMEYASDIPADRLIHVMELGRNLEQIEWDILINLLGGMEIKQIALSLEMHPKSVQRKIKKITELIKVTIG